MSTSPVIKLDHFYAHAPARVWRALTTPEIHARWWAAGDVRAEVGHRFELDMGAWGKQPCQVLAVEPERLLKYSFASGSLSRRSGGASLDTTITWLLTPEGSGTRLTLLHEGFDVSSPMGKKALEGMGRGWPGILDRLEGALAELAS